MDTNAEKTTAEQNTNEMIDKPIEIESEAATGTAIEIRLKDSSATASSIPTAKTLKAHEQPKVEIADCAETDVPIVKKTENEHDTILDAGALPATDMLTDDIPIISLSDGEDGVPTTLQKVKKRSSGSSVEEEQRFRLKRRKIKVAGAPKMPLTGYVRYMNDRRETLRKELPTKTAIEHTKIIGEEWHQLPEERKQPYMKAAELDKQRYLSELHTFLKERPDVLACELAKNKARKGLGDSGKSVLKDKSQSYGNIKTAKEPNNIKDKARSNSDKDSTPPPNDKPKSCVAAALSCASSVAPMTTAGALGALSTPGEIPIFTNEFLEHNKIFDMELRTLRKSKADLEQQNAVLEKHVENMKFGVEKMTSENDELQEKNRLLEIYLEKLKKKLANALAGLSIPSEPNGATLENIDKYMNDLYKMSTTNTHGPASLNKAKDIIRKLDLQIQL